MKKNMIVCMVSIVVCLAGCISQQTTIKKQKALIEAYEYYYRASQDFIYELDPWWCDGYDPYDFLSSMDKLDSLYKRKQYAFE